MARKPSPESVVGKALELPNHISYSARDTLERCAKAYFLSRIAKAPSRPALWLAGGSAVHEVTELYDLHAAGVLKSQPFDAREAWLGTFEAQLEELDAKDANRDRWRTTKQGVEEWRKDGLEYVQAWIDWRERSPWELWKTPDGEVAVELDVSGFLPGCEVEIKGYLDRVFHDPNLDSLYIVDIKTGTRMPNSPAQFGTYAALLKQKYGVTVQWGVPFMNRKAALGNVFDLTIFRPEYVGMTYGRAWKQIEAGGFNAHVGESCFICDVQESCYANGGHLSERFDLDDPAYAASF
jgi:putative RecB family exonuclease